MESEITDLGLYSHPKKFWGMESEIIDLGLYSNPKEFWGMESEIIDLGLHSHPKEFWVNGVRTHVNSKGNIPSTGGSEEDRTRNAASRMTVSPTH